MAPSPPSVSQTANDTPIPNPNVEANALPSSTDVVDSPIPSPVTTISAALSPTETPIMPPSPTPASLAGPPSPTVTSAAPAGFPGQVSENLGAFVTSTGHSSYYYARSDTGWHRIHPENRAWFLTADALLRAFPGRTLHATRTPTPVG